MKKLALVLGSLLVVGTAASAKEVVPAPVVVPEKVVEVVEKPVIVYRDREVAPAWRPNGSVDVQYRWYGETEKKTAKEDTDGDWADSANNYGRLQTVVNLNITENQRIWIRSRNYHTLKSENDSTRKADRLRMRHFYNFGTLGDSKVTAVSRLHYDQRGNDGAKEASASVAFDFSNYFFSNDFFKVTGFALRPEYLHGWSGHGNDGSKNRYALNLETSYDLPFGFSAELNLYGRYDRKLKDNRYANDKKHDLNLGVEAYLYNTTNLYKNGNFGLDFVFEGGYDEYTIHQKKLVENSNGNFERREYSLYALPALKATYKPTDFVSLYAAAGAEYRNWKVTAESEAKNWRWQPTAWAGMKVTF